jgi:hypothetical protein
MKGNIADPRVTRSRLKDNLEKLELMEFVVRAGAKYRMPV